MASPPPKRRKTNQETSLQTLNQEIRQKFEALACAPTQTLKKFLTPRSLQRIWTDELLGRFWSAHGVRPSTADRETARERCLSIVSILFDIQWANWTRFVELFLNHHDDEGKKDRLDDSLPFPTNKSDQVLGPQFGKLFFNCQHEYCPILIREGEHGHHTEGERLPFSSPKGVLIADGRYGSVFKEIIAPGQWLGTGKTRNDEPMVVARKVMANSVDFDFEIKNLKLFREGLANHTLLMNYKALLTVGDEFSIIYDLADMDLEAFLYQPDQERALSMDSLLLASSNLAHALRFLHQELRLEGSSVPQVCCHRDLKPNNILVFGNHVRYIWKISDFGISSIKSEWRQSGPMPRSARPATGVSELTRTSNQTTAHRGGGTFLAPEAIHNTARNVGTHSDIWSLGCILVQILVRGISGLKSLAKLDGLRGMLEDGQTNYPNDYFYRADHVVNPHVKDWISQLPTLVSGRFSQSFAQACQRLIGKMLSETADHRPTAGEVQIDLETIRNTLAQDDPMSSPQDDPMSSPQDDPMPSPQDDPMSSPQDDPMSSPQDDPMSSPQDDPMSSPQDSGLAVPTGTLNGRRSLSKGRSSLSETGLSLLRQYVPVRTMDSAPQWGHTVLASYEAVIKIQSFLTTENSHIFWIQESVVGRPSRLWPYTECIIGIADAYKIPAVMHLCQYRPIGGQASGHLALVYSLIYQAYQASLSDFDHISHDRGDTILSFDDSEASFFLALSTLCNMVEHCSTRCVILIDDFESVARENPRCAQQLLDALQRSLRLTKIKVFVTTSGKCALMEEFTGSQTREKVMDDPDRDIMDFESTLKEAISGLKID